MGLHHSRTALGHAAHGLAVRPAGQFDTLRAGWMGAGAPVCHENPNNSAVLGEKPASRPGEEH